ncbi:MAG: GNAT family N-acetyltransferase [Aeoliella sp.]
MSITRIETPRLMLALESLEETRARIDAMSATDKVDLSADWLSLLGSATSADPWILGFNMSLRVNNIIVGQCGFKGPPTPDGVVEIAYCVEPANQRNGYASEAALALVFYAFEHKEVQLVRAHTLPEANASTRVLTKCGFRNVGEVIDPDDGPVWRWEKQRDAADQREERDS